MFVATIVLTILLALAFLGSGGAKVAGAQKMRDSAAHLGFPYGGYRVVGALEVAGAVGLLIGLGWTPLGVAAVIGLILTMLGAVAFHLRAKDSARDIAPSTVFGVLGIALLVTYL